MLKKKQFVITTAVFLCAFIILLAHFQYFETRDRIVKLYSEKQIVLAQQVVLSVEKFFEERLQALELVADLAEDRNIPETEFARIYQLGYYRSIVLLDTLGTVKYKYPMEDISLILPALEERKNLVKRFQSISFESKVCSHSLQYRSSSFVCLQVPVGRRAERLSGVLLGIVDLNKSLTSVIEPVVAQHDAHIFILSGEGMVIYHPTHPEMLRNNINDNSGYCVTCHENFNLEKAILGKEIIWGEKEDIQGNIRLLAAASISLPGTSWTLAIDTPYRVITDANSRQFWMFFILSAAMVIVVIFGSTALYRIKKENLEMENRQREHFAFIGEMSTRIAHEIKNPLASLQAGIQLIEADLPENPDTRDYFQRLTGEVQRVDRIVKGLLSYAREEQLILENFDLGGMCRRVIDMVGTGIKNKNIEWELDVNDGNLNIKADPHKLEQVIWNLLLNATQAINRDGKISVKLTAFESLAKEVVISDNGEGIPADIMDKIFQPFYSSRSQGTGLGLAISKKIILAHSGTIDVDTEHGKGTVITIHLPG